MSKVLEFKQWDTLNELNEFKLNSKSKAINEWYIDEEELPLMVILQGLKENTVSLDDYISQLSADEIMSAIDSFWNYYQSSDRGGSSEFTANYPGDGETDPSPDKYKEVISFYIENEGFGSFEELVSNFTLNKLDYELGINEISREDVTQYVESLKEKGFKYWDTINMDGFNPIFISKISKKIGQLDFSNSIESLDEVIVVLNKL